MKAYRVHITAIDTGGTEIRFDELVTYPDCTTPVSEPIRESEAKLQVVQRMPYLSDVKTKGSCHI